MKRCCVASFLLLVNLLASGLPAQEPPTNALQSAKPGPPHALTVPVGEEIVLELKDPINTKSTKKGEKVTLTTTTELFAGGRVVVPKGCIVHATVAESKRPGRLFGKARIRLTFDEIEFADGTSAPLGAALSRAGWWGAKGSIDQEVKGEGGKSHDVITVSQTAAQGAILGGVMGGGKGAAEGAAAGAAASLIVMMLQRGPELDLPPGMMFEIELTQPLDVPMPAVEAAERVAQAMGTEEASLPSGNAAPPESEPMAPMASPVPVAAEASSKPPTETNPPAVIPPPPPTPPAPLPATAETGGYVLKMNVNLVLVEATVRDSMGGIADGLTRDDFKVFEDGAEQPIQYFSRDELPLAVALVVDRSGSIAPYLSELRDAALETLTELKPGDQVALFAFASSPERLEYLTSDRQRIARAISTIHAAGGTNITDALFEAALYLGRAASRARHAIILVSDNQGTVRGFESDKDLVRMALETETVIYSIRIGGKPGVRGLTTPLWFPGTTSVNKVTRETGGEIIDLGNGGTLGSAMSTVISRLKRRYTLGYLSPDKKKDGAFHEIQVRLAGAYAAQSGQYTIYARRGYYAPMERVAKTDK